MTGLVRLIVPLALAGTFGACNVVAGVNEKFVPDDSVDGWEGPYEILSSPDEPNACPTGYSEIGVYRRGLDATVSACDCDVPVAACATTLTVHDTPGCGDAGAATTLPANTCTDVDANGKHLLATLTATDLPCDGAAVLGEPNYDESARVCACQGGDCPAPPDIAQRCILQIGEVPECPASTFTERRVLYENEEDNRGCDCGVATCRGQLSWHVQLGTITATKACEEGLLAAPTVQADECTSQVSSLADTQVRFTMSVNTPSTCERDADEAATGELRLTSPVTICCEP